MTSNAKLITTMCNDAIIHDDKYTKEDLIDKLQTIKDLVYWYLGEDEKEDEEEL